MSLKKHPTAIKIQSSIDMFLPAVVEAPLTSITAQRRLSFISEDFFFFLSFVAFFLAVTSDFGKVQPLC